MNVPTHYGDLVAVTPHGDQAVLWFRNGEGVVRNAVAGSPAETLYRFEPSRSANLEYRVLR